MVSAVCETIVNTPFGDGQAASGSCSDSSPMHFTGKQRDTETNLEKTICCQKCATARESAPSPKYL